MDGIHHPFDALMPRQIAFKAEDVGVTKARLDFMSMFLLAVLAGAFISMGAVFSTVSVAGAAGVVPYGLARVMAGVSFSLGLVLVVIAGAELFTGNNLLIMAFASRKVTAMEVLRNWVVVYTGNFFGALATAYFMFLAGLHHNGSSAVGRVALLTAQPKCDLRFDEAFIRGVYCNALVCLAVWLCMSCRSTGEKIAAVMFPVTAFVAAGFEHSVANMYFIPAAMFIRQSAPPEFWETVKLAPADFSGITWSRFLIHNLIPVTLGNIVGGGLFVGSIYWVIYARKRPGAGPALAAPGQPSPGGPPPVTATP